MPKKIKKAEKCVVYENTVRELFSCEQFKKGAEAKGHQVNMVQSLRRLYEKWRYLCIKKMTWLKYSECFGKQMYLYWLLRFIFMESVPR
ncbi:hypothetical protein M5E86_15420 [Blautia wexlerae]|nr:hypothetical protein M5E86_15420 [Blautia wexlerae]